MNQHAEMTAAAEAAARVTDGVRPEQFSAPTPCTDWDVRELVNHLTPAGRARAPRRAGRCSSGR